MALTYEKDDRNIPLETYEWDDIWFDHAPDTDKPRILLVGDSISKGYRTPAIKELNDSYHTDNWATSMAVDNPAFLKQLDLILMQAKGYKLIHMNNGLHGWHLSTEEYKKHYEAIIRHILENYPQLKLVLALTTPVRIQETKELHQYTLPINDLYNSELIKSADTYTDTVHQNEEGYNILAKMVNNKIKEVLK